MEILRKIEILTGCVGSSGVFIRGKVYDVTAEIAKDLTNAGHARYVAGHGTASVEKAVVDTNKIHKR